MTTEKVNDLEVVSLKDYFKVNTFRLIPADIAHIKGGISEVPVEINIHSDFGSKLTFDTRNLQKFYGFSIMGPKLQEVNGGMYYSPARKGQLKVVELNDSGDLWIMKFEMFDGTKKLYSFKAEEVLSILNECRKPALLDITLGLTY